MDGSSQLIPTQTLVHLINERHGTTLVLGERYAVGEQGAFALTDESGARFVLKWGTPDKLQRLFETAAVVADRLRERGYPTPAYHYIGRVAGVSYAVQGALPGAPMGHVHAEFVPELLRLNGLQQEQALPGPRDWPAPVVDTILVGGDGYCVLETLRNHSPATRGLLAMLQATVSAVIRRGDPFATNDVVHFDFSPANILVANKQVSGVIDWDGACAGDRAFDLATLLFYGYNDLAVRKILRRHLLEQIGPGPLNVYLAHMIIRQVEWVIRFYDRPLVVQWLHLVRPILHDMRASGEGKG